MTNFIQAVSSCFGRAFAEAADAALLFPELTPWQGRRLIRSGINSRDEALKLGPIALMQRVKGFGPTRATQVHAKLQQANTAHNRIPELELASALAYLDT